MGSEFAGVLERALNRDEAAFASLWRAHHPPLLRFLRTFDRAAAEDLAAETWLHAARDLHRFHGDELGFRAWLFTIARRRLIDLQRSAGRRPRIADRGVPEGAAPDTAVVAGDAMDIEAALRIVAQLPRDQAEVVVLRAIAGLDVGHVARIVGKRPGTVRVLAHRGLRRLSELLAGAP